MKSTLIKHRLKTNQPDSLPLAVSDLFPSLVAQALIAFISKFRGIQVNEDWNGFVGNMYKPIKYRYKLVKEQ